jgi:hypothetical protein
VSEAFCLYVLTMNDKCYEVLTDLNLPNLKPIRLADFEDDKLLKAKSNRNLGEYCWTCTSSLVLYLLDKYHLEYCTYIDADMYFYQDPQLLIDEMIYAGASAQIVEHRFPKGNNRASIVGKYCVEFNTFKNDGVGLSILKEWRDDCLECCSNKGDGIHWGDQKYLDKWIPKYGIKVNVLSNLGAGVAPWNLEQYKYISTINNDILLKEIESGKVFSLFFYHFENLTYLDNHFIRTSAFLDKCKSRFAEALYGDYLLKIEQTKRLLDKKYSVRFLLKYHPAVNDKKKEPSAYIYLTKFLWYFIRPWEVINRVRNSRIIIKI